MGGHRHCGSGLEGKVCSEWGDTDTVGQDWRGRSAVSGGTQTLWVRTGGKVCSEWGDTDTVGQDWREGLQ